MINNLIYITNNDNEYSPVLPFLSVGLGGNERFSDKDRDKLFKELKELIKKYNKKLK